MNTQNSLYIYIYKQMISTIKNQEEMIICDVLMFYMLLTKFKFVC